MRFALFRNWVMPEYQPIEENGKIAKRAIFDLITFSEWAQMFKDCIMTIIRPHRGRTFSVKPTFYKDPIPSGWLKKTNFFY
jgi:hypothetical protein